MLDFTGAEAIRTLGDDLADRGIVLALARVKQDLLVKLERAGIVDMVGSNRLFPTLPSAVDAYRMWVQQLKAEGPGDLGPEAL